MCSDDKNAYLATHPRKELTKEYDERRQRQKENRWGKSSDKDNSKGGGSKDEPEGTSNFPIPANFLIDTSRAEYYIQRLDTWTRMLQ